MQSALSALWVLSLPLQVLLPEVHGTRCGALAIARAAVIGQRELEERHAISAPTRFVVGLSAHEVADHRDVAVALVVGELLLPLDERVVIGVHPGMRHLGAEKLKAQSTDATAPCELDR